MISFSNTAKHNICFPNRISFRVFFVVIVCISGLNFFIRKANQQDLLSVTGPNLEMNHAIDHSLGAIE